MLLKLPNVLTPEAVGELRRFLEAQPFQDGRQSGNPKLKNNLQVLGRNPQVQQAVQTVTQALLRNPTFTAFALPKTFQVMFNRYEPGMFYKDHMDAALMGGLTSQPLRTDLSFTVFLSDPASYEGGDFVMRTSFGDLTVRGEPGHAICYPSNMLHRVEPVTQGARWAAVGWLQSFVRDLDERLVMFELEQLRGRVTRHDVEHPEDEAFGRLRENLMRLWVDA